jgi:predicted ATPase
LAHALSKEAYLQLYLGTPTAALGVAEELQALADERGIAFFGAAAIFFRGWCHSLFGDVTEGLTLIRRATELYRATDTLLHIPSFLRVESEILGRSGEAGAGLAKISEAKAILAKSGERWEEAEIRRTEGELLGQLGRIAAAEAALSDAQRIAVTQGAHLFALRARVSMAELLSRQGRRAEASSALTAAVAQFAPDCDAPDLRHAQDVLLALQ